MSGEALTPGGKVAYGLLDAAFADPAKAADVQLQIGALWRAETDPAAKLEIGGAATICSRLAGSAARQAEKQGPALGPSSI